MKNQLQFGVSLNVWFHMLCLQILTDDWSWSPPLSQKCSTHSIGIWNCDFNFSDLNFLDFLFNICCLFWFTSRHSLVGSTWRKTRQQQMSKKNPKNSNQKNWNHNFIWQWNELNIFVMIDGIKIHHILKSGRKSRNNKHFRVSH